MSNSLPNPPDPRRSSPREMYQWFERISKLLAGGSMPWSVVNKVGSLLSDLEGRAHSMLTDILGWSSGADTTQNKHISAANGKKWEDHADLASATHHGVDHDATYAAKAVEGDLSTHIAATSAHGTTGAVVGTTDAQVISGKKFGGATHYSEFEADGTLHFAGDATVWKDIKFPMAPPKTTGAGNPTLTTYNGNMRGYSFALNDAHDFDPQEIDHDAMVGATATWHVHFLSRSNDGTDRKVKYEIEYAIEPTSGALPAPTVVSAEITIPAGTAANTPQRLNIDTFTVPTIAKMAYARIKRIASSGTEPSVDPVFSALHFHYVIDTVGSRDILSK